jgi:hypothetical protein
VTGVQTCALPIFINDSGETAPAGILAQIPDANQEIVNDETDGIDNTYNEVA